MSRKKCKIKDGFGKRSVGKLLGELRKNFCEVNKRTDQVAAEKAGFGNETTCRQAKTVTRYATPELAQAMDQTLACLTNDQGRAP